MQFHTPTHSLGKVNASYKQTKDDDEKSKVVTRTQVLSMTGQEEDDSENYLH
jgi:hypothetical protein